mmetsp:Transcript_118/g.364  ORF Transcript_118/g.364 Transcript_118/m.364 type:complete len:210 (+) Transcript_118:141-770(+)
MGCWYFLRAETRRIGSSESFKTGSPLRRRAPARTAGGGTTREITARFHAIKVYATHRVGSLACGGLKDVQSAAPSVQETRTPSRPVADSAKGGRRNRRCHDGRGPWLWVQTQKTTLTTTDITRGGRPASRLWSTRAVKLAAPRGNTAVRAMLYSPTLLWPRWETWAHKFFRELLRVPCGRPGLPSKLAGACGTIMEVDTSIACVRRTPR